MSSMMSSETVQSFADWSSLPEHLWLTIFSRCPAMDLLAIRDVCMDWRRIAADFSLTTHLFLRSEDSPTILLNSLINLLMFASNNLLSLKIDGKVVILESIDGEPMNGRSNRSSHMKIMSTLRTDCQRLCRLSLNNFDVIYLPYDELSTGLTHLCLVNCNELCLQLFEVFSQYYTSIKFSSIVYLNMSQVLEFDSFLCRSLNRFVSLKYLYLEQLFRVNDGGISHINHQIISQLVVIDLEGTDIKDESFEYILNNGHSLEDLYLSRTQISGNFDLNKSEAKRLKVLCLLNTGINSMIVRNILRTHPSLQSVNCDKSINETIDSHILTTDEPTTDTCCHYLIDNRFYKI